MPNHGIVESIKRRARESDTVELFIWKDGNILLEDTQKPGRLWNSYSISKSLVSLGFGIAMDEHLITSLDTAIVHYFPELRATDKEAITLRQLLNHTSGIYAPFGFKNDWQELSKAKDIVAFTFASPQAFKPGEHFFYNNKATAILPTLLERISGIPFLTFMQSKLFSPLGVTNVSWQQDLSGHYFGMSGVSLAARDLGKIGQLILQKGQWHGQQIVSSQWLELMATPSQPFNPRAGLLWYRSPHAWASDKDPHLCVYWDKELIATFKEHRLNPGIIAWIEQQGSQGLSLHAMHRSLGKELVAVFYHDFAMHAFDHMLPLYRVQAKAEYGIAAHGWMGQQLVIMPDKNLVAARLCNGERGMEEKYLFSDLPELLRHLP